MYPFPWSLWRTLNRLPSVWPDISALKRFPSCSPAIDCWDLWAQKKKLNAPPMLKDARPQNNTASDVTGTGGAYFCSTGRAILPSSAWIMAMSLPQAHCPSSPVEKMIKKNQLYSTVIHKRFWAVSRFFTCTMWLFLCLTVQKKDKLTFISLLDCIYCSYCLYTPHCLTVF